MSWVDENLDFGEEYKQEVDYRFVKYNTVLDETPKAYQLALVMYDKKEFHTWLPKSQVKLDRKAKEVAIPEWLYEKTRGEYRKRGMI